MEQILMDYLAKTLGKTNEEIADILYKKGDDGKPTDQMADNALEALETLHEEHLSSLKGDESALKAEFDKGHQAGKFEALSKLEETISKKYGLPKVKVETQIEALAKKAAEEAGTEDKVITHPRYLSLLEEKESEVSRLKSEYEKELSEIKSATERKARFMSAVQHIEATLEKVGADIPTQRAKAAFLAEFENMDFEETDGKLWLKGPDGKILKDKFGHAVTLQKHVEAEAANWFKLAKQPKVETPGNDPSAPPTASKWTKENAPKTGEDFQDALFKAQTPEEKAEIAKAFMEARKEGQ